MFDHTLEINAPSQSYSVVLGPGTAKLQSSFLKMSFAVPELKNKKMYMRSDSHYLLATSQITQIVSTSKNWLTLV